MTDPKLMSIVRQIAPAGPGPDAPLFAAGEMAKLTALPSAEADLLELVRDANCDPATRFIAAEGLVESSLTAWRNKAENRRDVADVLAKAMADDQSHNRWGLPGSFLGPFGKRLLSLGAEAESALVPLLSDGRLLNIEGSEAATLNSQFKFRVSDLAGWLIASSFHLPWPPEGTSAERDAAIAELRSRMENRK